MEEHTSLPVNTIIQPQQILLPKKVYIGDTAELRCTFNSNAVIFNQLVMDGPADLSLSIFTAPLDAKDFEILQVKLNPAGVNYYQLSVIFKAWKTGSVQFPPIQLKDTIIEFQSVPIVSITEQNNTTILKDTVSPFLLPGTTYKLYGAIIALILLIIIGIRLFIKRERIIFYINNKRLLKKYKKNKKQTIKELQSMAKNTESDKAFAENYQHLIRKYLEVRFDYGFSNCSSSELVKGFIAATNNLASEQKTEAFGDIASTFIRTDYIRYKTGATLFENEKQDMCRMVIEKIEILESVEAPEALEGGENA